MSKYSEVDWEKAQCKELEIDTNLFYTIEEERSVVAYDYINSLRSICASCPIWKECLTYAMENENYGMWGGLTSVERISMTQPLKYPNQRVRAISSMKGLGISLEQIMECVEAQNG